ncbi:alpha/beta hydrolase [Streptomyces xiamenensis]
MREPVIDPVRFPTPTRFEGGSGRVALVLPGMGYSPARPLLHFARAALLAAGWTVRELWWQVPPDLSPTRSAAWVRERAEEAIAAEDGACGLLVGKSLGTMAAPLAQERELPAIWLTPLLRDAGVTAALAGATAPALLIGGTADERWWDPAIAASLPHEVVEIPGADHALELPGDLAGSVLALHRAVTAMETFLGRLRV